MTARDHVCTETTRLTRIEERMEDLPLIRAKLDQILEHMQKIDETINGNGKPGMKQDVALNTDFRIRTQKVFDHLMIKMAGIMVVLMVLALAAAKVLL